MYKLSNLKFEFILNGYLVTNIEEEIEMGEKCFRIFVSELQTGIEFEIDMSAEYVNRFESIYDLVKESLKIKQIIDGNN